MRVGIFALSVMYYNLELSEVLTSYLLSEVDIPAFFCKQDIASYVSKVFEIQTVTYSTFFSSK